MKTVGMLASILRQTHEENHLKYHNGQQRLEIMRGGVSRGLCYVI